MNLHLLHAINAASMLQMSKSSIRILTDFELKICEL